MENSYVLVCFLLWIHTNTTAHAEQFQSDPKAEDCYMHRSSQLKFSSTQRRSTPSKNLKSCLGCAPVPGYVRLQQYCGAEACFFLNFAVPVHLAACFAAETQACWCCAVDVLSPARIFLKNAGVRIFKNHVRKVTYHC